MPYFSSAQLLHQRLVLIWNEYVVTGKDSDV